MNIWVWSMSVGLLRPWASAVYVAEQVLGASLPIPGDKSTTYFHFNSTADIRYCSYITMQLICHCIVHVKMTSFPSDETVSRRTRCQRWLSGRLPHWYYSSEQKMRNDKNLCLSLSWARFHRHNDELGSEGWRCNGVEINNQLHQIW